MSVRCKIYSTFLIFQIFLSQCQLATQYFNQSSFQQLILNIGDTAMYFYITDDSPNKLLDAQYYWYDKGLINTSQMGYFGHLLNGKYSIVYQQKYLIQSGNFLNGLKDGEWIERNICGSIIESQQFKMGRLNGICNYYSNDGTLVATKEYKNGELNGSLILYRSDTIFSSIKYLKGEPKDTLVFPQ